MKEQRLTGVFPIAPATFDSAGAYDYETYAAALSRILEGADGVALFGIAGEYYKLTADEEVRLLHETVSICRRMRKPVIISNTRHSTHAAVAWAREIERAGADCLMILPPFFLKPSADELLNHMRKVAEAVSIPVMIQYAPEQTGLPLSPDVLSELYRSVPNAKYFKIESKPPGHYISRLLELTESEASVFVGNAGFQLIEGLDRGGTGVMPGPSLFDVYRRILDLYYDEERDRATELHRELVYFLNHIRQNVEMIIMSEKLVLQKRGITGEPGVRRPAYDLDVIDRKILDELYARLESAFSISYESITT